MMHMRCIKVVTMVLKVLTNEADRKKKGFGRCSKSKVLVKHPKFTLNKVDHEKFRLQVNLCATLEMKNLHHIVKENSYNFSSLSLSE
jgi:hypothetical protein